MATASAINPAYSVDMHTIAFPNSAQVTPSDSVSTPQFAPSYIRVGGAGTLVYIALDGVTQINYGTVAAGERVIALATGVMVTGTSATPITRHW